MKRPNLFIKLSDFDGSHFFVKSGDISSISIPPDGSTCVSMYHPRFRYDIPNLVQSPEEIEDLIREYDDAWDKYYEEKEG